MLHDGVFAAARGLFGIELVPRTDLVGYHPDVRIWEVRDASGEPIGLFLGDYYAREGKRGGAWMSTFVDQSDLCGTRPVVVNVLNIPQPAAGEHALLTLDEVRTLFHEFGHALHGLFSQVTLPAVVRDQRAPGLRRVPQPGQRDVDPLAGGRWRTTPGTSRTGEPLPTEVVESIRAAAAVGRGLRAPPSTWPRPLLDQAWHRIAAGRRRSPTSSRSRRRRWRAAGIDLPLIPPRYRSTYFQHIFDGGYSAGYYSYIWSEVLDADTVDMVQGERRADPGERRPLPREAAVGRRVGRRDGRVPVGARAGRRTSSRCCGGAGWTARDDRLCTSGLNRAATSRPSTVE